jgi:hypothetical protein
MNRADVIAEIRSLRRRRDRCWKGSMFERGLAAGFHLAASSLWRAWRNCL